MKISGWLRCGMFILALAALLLAGCGRKASAPVTAADTAPAATLPESPLPLTNRMAADYPFDPATPLAQRVGIIPDGLLAGVRIFGGDNSYTAYQPTDEERQVVARVLADLPASYRAVLQEKLQGIYFVKGWQFGMTDWLLREDGSLVFYLVFGPETLRWSATQLLTFKENTAFQARGPAVMIDCGSEALGLDYMMLHEVTHIVDGVRGITPYVDPELLKVRGFVPHSDENISAVWKDYSTLRPAYNWPYRGKVNFYGLNGGPQLPGSRAHRVYENLQRTPCVSLYGTLTCVEDLAEIATFDIMANRRHVPYRITVENQAGHFVYEPMQKPELLERLPAVRAILGYE